RRKQFLHDWKCDADDRAIDESHRRSEDRRRENPISPHALHYAKRPSISANGIARPSAENVPFSAISCAAARNPLHAARASAPPMLIRRTPAAARSATVVKSLPARTFTGFGASAS